MSIYSPENLFLRLTTREQSRSLDEQTIQAFGLSGSLLMEIAGMKAAEYIRDQTGDNKHGVFICGKGNNAGDAFVAARYLLERASHSADIRLVSGDANLSPDAAKNLELLRKLKENGAEVTISTKTPDLSSATYHYGVDGMIGTGLTSDLRSPLTARVSDLNQSRLTIFAMDIPTGLHCDSGRILGSCVKADHTLTFGTNKTGFYMGRGPKMTGSLFLADLPFPKYLREHKAVLIGNDLSEELPDHTAAAAHKYEKGTVHIVAGSAGMTGAAMMAAKSAWAAGAGAVFLYAPKGILQVYEISLPQIIKVPVGEPDDTHFKPFHVSDILAKISDKKGPVLAGPGLGNADETRTGLAELLNQVESPVILDADGLAAWQQSSSAKPSGWILTPHPGELKNYLNISSADDFSRLSGIQKLADSSGCHILSKGSPTFYVSADGAAFITGYDTSIFARAGFGDVLAGTIAGKLAVSKPYDADRSVVSALIDTHKAIQHIPDAEPKDIYDR